MNREVIVTCAVTGGHYNFADHPDFPATPKKIAAAAVEAARAGAAVVHIHARDPATGRNSRNPDHFREIVERVRESGVDVVINLTGGNGGVWFPDPDEPLSKNERSDVVGPALRINHAVELLPEICSLDCGPFCFGDGVYVTSMPFLRTMARQLLDLGIKPEMEVFELGHIVMANLLVKEGLVAGPPLYQLCLGIPHSAPADPAVMQVMRDQLPPDAIWASFAISRMEMPFVAQSVLMGGHVRVGLEDNLYLDKGVYATNGQLVERAIGIVEGLGARAVTPDEARAMLKLKKRG